MAEPSLTLSMTALRRAGQLLGGEPSQLSPMYSPDPVAFEDGLDELQRTGVVDESGSVRAVFADTLEALLTPPSFAEVTVFDTDVTANHTVMFAASDRRPILLTATAEGLMIRDPGPMDRVAEGLTQLFGMSVVGGSDFTVSVPSDEALVLAAVLDEFRRMMLGQLATGSPMVPVDVPAIRKNLEDRTENRQWLLTAVRSQVTGSPELVDVDGALSGLADLGLIESNGSNVVLAGTAQESLAQMLLIRRGLRVTAGHAVDSELRFIDFAGLSFGMHDMLRLEETDGTVRFDLTSSALLIGHVAQLLLDSRVLADGMRSGD